MYKPEGKQECLAHNIRLFCEVNGITLADMETLLGVSSAALRNWLACRSMPQTTGRVALEKVFGVKFDKICTTAMTIKLNLDRSQTIETVYPYNCLIEARSIGIRDSATLSDYEYFEDAEFNMDYKLISPADYDRMFRDKLNYREQMVLELRFRDGLTLEAVGTKMGTTRERVRQIESKALRKLSRAVQNMMETRTKVSKILDKHQQLPTLIAEVISDQSKVTDVQPEASAPVSLQMLIEDMDFSVRTYNCLKRAYINTLSDIVNYNESFIYIRNLGRNSLNEIITKVGGLNIGYRFDYELQHFVVSDLGELPEYQQAVGVPT